MLDEANKDSLQVPLLVEKYDSYIELCLEGTHTIAINMTTQDVQCVDNSSLKDYANNDFLLLNSFILDALTTPVSKRHRAFLNKQFQDIINSADIVNNENQDEREEDYKKMIKLLCYYSLAYIAICTPKFISNCRHKSTRHYNLSFCLLYFLIFDNGFTQLAQVLIDNVNKVDSLDPEFHFIKEQIIKSMVNVSIAKGYEKKESWKKIAGKQVDIDDEDTINNTLSRIKGTAGRKPDNRILEELLIGDKKKLLLALDDFIADKYNLTIDLACLFCILEETQHIDCGYETFHNAINIYAEKDRFGVVSAPQTQLKEIKANVRELYVKDYDSHYKLNGDKWNNIRKLFDIWKPIFSQIQ